MSALPKSVRKKVTEANELHKQVYTPPEKAEEPKEEAEPENPAVVENQDLKMDSTEAEVVDLKTEQPETQPSEDWEQKYRVINGKYKAEVPKLHQEVRQLQGEVTGLRELLSNLDSMKPPEAPAPTQTVSQGTLLKPDEIEDYGSDLIDVMKRAGQEAMSPEFKRLQDEIVSLKQQLGGVSQTVETSARDKIFTLLSSKVPNWEELNIDPGFLNWLDQEDPYSGISRQQMLKSAFEKNDGARVITFFQGYLNENDTIQPAQQETTPERTPQKKLDDLVAPGRPKAPVAAAQKGKRTWTQAQIAAFYKDVTSGKYRNNPDKKAALEQDIINAPLEGRLVF